MQFAVSLTKRTRKRKLLGGATVLQTRYVLNYRDPKTGGRRQEFYELQKEAQNRRSELLVKVGSGSYVDERTVPTVAEAIDHWLADKVSNVKANTLAGYKVVTAHIRGPFLIAAKQARAEFTLTGERPVGAKFLPMLGAIKISDLTTAAIRTWHREVTEHAGAYTANRAKSHLKSILALAEEDYGVRAPSLPVGIGRGRQKVKKSILTTPDIARLIEAARTDPERGVYYAFPFLAGTRPSEQLGLLWEDVDFVVLSSPGMPCMRCCGFITDARLTLEAEQYGAAGGRPQVVWPNGVLASTAVGLAVQIVTPWFPRPPTFTYLEYDGNRGTLTRSARVELLKDHVCRHHPAEETGDPLFDIRKHIEAVEARIRATERAAAPTPGGGRFTRWLRRQFGKD